MFRVYSGTYGSDDLVEWFAEEGIVVEDHTPKEECYKVMPHPVHTWELMGLNIFIVIPGNICVLYLMYRDFHLESVTALCNINRKRRKYKRTDASDRRKEQYHDDAK